MTQIERIEYMENIFDKTELSVKKLQNAIEEYKTAIKYIKELEAYYESDTWRQDYEDDENGKIPENLKRGVLSEDGIYSLLEENTELIENISQLARDICD